MATGAKIGFIGIGNMGGPMAANLIKAGFDVTVYDSDKQRMADFAEDHDCAVAASLADLPMEKQALYNYRRNSKVFFKAL